MKVLGHRGCKYEVENTIRSFERAFELGADGIELDTQSTSDGVIVVSHDENLKRVFGVDFKIQEHTLFELEGITKDGEKVPTLESVLEIARSKNKIVDVELKNPKDLEAVSKIVQSFNYDGFFISSFYHSAMLEGKKRFPKIQFAFLYAHVPTDISLYAKEIDLLKPEVEFVIPEYKNYASITIPWTVNEKEDFEKLLALNIFAVISDYPDKILAFIREKQAH
ncbi:glycerophosphodiester phosphodiesterase [Caldisericum sp. AR60]|uniref:glycerophosphodiester phosphodiesterase n=1 Tax=Caldisericum sp. AR60 TaxID=3397852 RepID=UPI0039FD58DF